MTIVALPPNHDHLADALVRDLGFTKQHVDHELHELALALDPLVEPGVQLANMGRAPRLSARLDRHDGDWRLAATRAPEITRFLEALREVGLARSGDLPEGDVVLTDVPDDRYIPDGWNVVAIEGRTLRFEVEHMIPEGGVVMQEKAIVEWVKSVSAPAPKKARKMAGVSSSGVEMQGLKDLVDDLEDGTVRPATDDDVHARVFATLPVSEEIRADLGIPD